MNTKKDWVEGLLFAGFRLMSVGLILTGFLGMIFQLAESWFRFDPNYLVHFLAETVLRPFVVLFAGLVLAGLSGKLAHWMAVRHNRHSS